MPTRSNPTGMPAIGQKRTPSPASAPAQASGLFSNSRRHPCSRCEWSP